MLLAFLLAFRLGVNEQEMINVIVFLQWAFSSPDHPGRTFAQVVAEEGLVDVTAFEVFIVTTFRIVRAPTLTFFSISHKSMDLDSVFPELLKITHMIKIGVTPRLNCHHNKYRLLGEMRESMT